MYQVWIKNEYDEFWKLTECATLKDVKDAFIQSLTQGQPAKVTQELKVSVEVKVTEAEEPPAAPEAEQVPEASVQLQEEVEYEITQGGPEGDQGPGAEGNGPV